MDFDYNEKPKTIGKNQRKKAEEIFNNAYDIFVYANSNGYRGTKRDKLDYKGENWLLKDWLEPDYAKLLAFKDYYELKYHRNHWVYFKSIKLK